MASIHRPPLMETSSENAEQLAQFSLNKLMPRMHGLIRVVSVKSHMMTIDENGFHTSVITDRASQAPNQSYERNTTQKRAARDRLARN